MAKKKSVALPEVKAAATANKKQTSKIAVSKGTTSRVPSETSPSKRGLAQEEIGQVAGEVWHALSERGDQSLAALKKTVNAPSDVVLAAIGWLAREGKLDFANSNRSVTISLR